jgi:hypothetical protein
MTEPPIPDEVYAAVRNVLIHPCEPCNRTGKRDGDDCPACMGWGWWSSSVNPSDPEALPRAIAVAVAPLVAKSHAPAADPDDDHEIIAGPVHRSDLESIALATGKLYRNPNFTVEYEDDDD